VIVQNFRTSDPQIFASGDMIDGASLVVTAINSGRKMASTLKKIIAERKENG
jgi:glutamate synthase (NADPH/NADH) small chain